MLAAGVDNLAIVTDGALLAIGSGLGCLLLVSEIIAALVYLPLSALHGVAIEYLIGGGRASPFLCGPDKHVKCANGTRYEYDGVSVVSGQGGLS